VTQNQASALRRDVIVVGAGPNGMAMALALGRENVRVLLVDGRSRQSFASQAHDTRGTALTRATQNMFKALGCWDDLKVHAAEMRDVIVTDGRGSHDSRPVLLSFTTEPEQKASAAIVENHRLAMALHAAVEQSSQIELWTSCQLAEVTRAAGFVTLTFEDGRRAKAPLLIGADGRNSFVRQDASIAVMSHDDNQSALTFSIAHDLPHGQRAEEHFSPSGVFALLPLPGQRSSVVWGTTPEEAARLMALDETPFEEALNARLGTHLGRARVEGAKQAYPLKRQVAAAITARRTALIGDAAHTIHPLAGLGLNLGFKDAAILAECVSDALKRGEDLGGDALLARYETWRRFDIVSTAVAMEGMNALFANDWPFLRLLRQAGLGVVDAAPFIKSAIMAEASGLTGALPRLMRAA
jgi:2-octaprenyl-6-methoxyphenol hydroxylase